MKTRDSTAIVFLLGVVTIGGYFLLLTSIGT